MSIDTASLDMIQGSLFETELTLETFNGTVWVPRDLTGIVFEFKVLDCEEVDSVVLRTDQVSSEGEIVQGPTQGVLQIKIYPTATIGLESSQWALWANPGTNTALREMGGNIDYHKELQP